MDARDAHRTNGPVQAIKPNGRKTDDAASGWAARVRSLQAAIRVPDASAGVTEAPGSAAAIGTVETEFLALPAWHEDGTTQAPRLDPLARDST
jgi:hypothetical protein